VYFGHLIDALDDDLGCVYKDGYCSLFFLEGCLFIMGVCEIDVVGEETHAAPKEEAVDPPSQSITVLF
jgi:hypothetical protein